MTMTLPINSKKKLLPVLLSQPPGKSSANSYGGSPLTSEAEKHNSMAGTTHPNASRLNFQEPINSEVAKFKLYKKIWEQQQQSEKSRVSVERQEKSRAEKEDED